MIRRPPRSTLDRSSAASDVYKRQPKYFAMMKKLNKVERPLLTEVPKLKELSSAELQAAMNKGIKLIDARNKTCLLYTSDAADERSSVDLGGRRIIKKKKRTNYSHTR